MRCEGETEGGASEDYKETFMNCKQAMDLLCLTTRNERFLRDYQCMYVVLYIHVHICDPSTHHVRTNTSEVEHHLLRCVKTTERNITHSTG